MCLSIPRDSCPSLLWIPTAPLRNCCWLMYASEKSRYPYWYLGNWFEFDTWVDFLSLTAEPCIDSKLTKSNVKPLRYPTLVTFSVWWLLGRRASSGTLYSLCSFCSPGEKGHSGMSFLLFERDCDVLSIWTWTVKGLIGVVVPRRRTDTVGNALLWVSGPCHLVGALGTGGFLSRLKSGGSGTWVVLLLVS